MEPVGSNLDQMFVEIVPPSFDANVIFQASSMDGFATPMQSTVTVEATTKPSTKLTGDVNGDGTVNIFDLVIVAGNFGQSYWRPPLQRLRSISAQIRSVILPLL